MLGESFVRQAGVLEELRGRCGRRECAAAARGLEANEARDGWRRSGQGRREGVERGLIS